MPFENAPYADKLTANRRWGLPTPRESHFELTLKSLSSMFGLGVKQGATGIKYLRSDPRYYLPASDDAEVGFRDGIVGMILSVRIAPGLKPRAEFTDLVAKVCEEMPDYHFWCEGEMFRCFVPTAHALKDGYVSIDAKEADLSTFAAVPVAMRKVMSSTVLSELLALDQLRDLGQLPTSGNDCSEFCI